MKTNLNYFKSISHTFNAENKKVGYEYVINLSDDHVLVESYDSTGKLLSLKHQFIKPLNTGSSQDFVAYMQETESASFNWNLKNLPDILRKKIIVT